MHKFKFYYCIVVNIQFLVLSRVLLTEAQTVMPCLDANSTICSMYLQNGYCNIYTSVQNYCPLSCNLCNSVQTAILSTFSLKTLLTTSKVLCQDSDAMICPQYAVAGYCATYSSVQKYCPVSCELCSNLETITPLSTTVTLCKDSDTTICQQYAAASYCPIYTSVQSYCPFSCGLCNATSYVIPSNQQTNSAITTNTQTNISIITTIKPITSKSSKKTFLTTTNQPSSSMFYPTNESLMSVSIKVSRTQENSSNKNKLTRKLLILLIIFHIK